MKQPIAMKCTQEQFEAIEPKLKNHVNDIKKLDSFKSFEYLTNFFRREENCISNLSKKGLWYKETVSFIGKMFVYIESIQDKNNVTCYGFNGIGEWFNSMSGFGTHGLELATEQEVFEAIEKEINRRYKVGYYLKNHQGTWQLKNLNLVNRLFNNRISENVGIYNKQESGKWLLLDGKWADFIEQITLSEAEQQLGKKIIV